MALVSMSPALPVGLAHAVLQGDDGVVLGELLPHVHQLLAGHGLLGLGQVVATGLLVVPLGGGGVDGDHEVVIGLVPGGLDGRRRWPSGRPRPSSGWGRSRPRRPRRRRGCRFPSGRSSGCGRPQRSMRRASRQLLAPTGMTMNSWMSTLLVACAPPFKMFIMGTGRVLAFTPPR